MRIFLMDLKDQKKLVLKDHQSLIRGILNFKFERKISQLENIKRLWTKVLMSFIKGKIGVQPRGLVMIFSKGGEASR